MGYWSNNVANRPLALVNSTAEYCAPVWCRRTHTRLIDRTINNALRIVTGYLRPTPADNLPILAGIQPAGLHRSGATLSLVRRDMEPGHLLHPALTRPSTVDARRLKSRHPFVPAAQQLISFSDNNSIRAAQWADHHGMRSGRTTPQDSAFSFQIPAPTLRQNPSQEEPGSGITASTPVSDVSAHACTVQLDGLICGLRVWRRRKNRRPCCPPISNPSTSP